MRFKIRTRLVQPVRKIRLLLVFTLGGLDERGIRRGDGRGDRLPPSGAGPPLGLAQAAVPDGHTRVILIRVQRSALTGQGNGIRQILPVSAGVAIVGHQPGRGRIEVAVKPICRKKNLAVCAGDRGQQVGQLPGTTGGPDDGKPDQRQRNLRGGAGYVHKRCVGVGVGAALVELEPAHGDRCAVGHHDGHACRLPPAVKAVNGEIAVYPGGDIHRRVLGLGPAPVEHHAIAGYAENRPCAAVTAHL